MSNRISQDMAYLQFPMKYASAEPAASITKAAPILLLEETPGRHSAVIGCLSRRQESLFRVMRKPGMFPQSKKYL